MAYNKKDLHLTFLSNQFTLQSTTFMMPEYLIVSWYFNRLTHDDHSYKGKSNFQ